MRIVTRLLALARYLMLRRQAQEIRGLIQALPASARRALASLTLREIEAAAREPIPHLYASDSHDRYQPWGTATAESIQRARSSVPQLKLKGIATWLAVVFHETQESPHGELQSIHREVLGFLGQLKGTYAAMARGEVQAAA